MRKYIPSTTSFQKSRKLMRDDLDDLLFEVFAAKFSSHNLVNMTSQAKWSLGFQNPDCPFTAVLFSGCSAATEDPLITLDKTFFSWTLRGSSCFHTLFGKSASGNRSFTAIQIDTPSGVRASSLEQACWRAISAYFEPAFRDASSQTDW